jgi:lambda repressor-like predicted transcriptional regulator
MHPADIKAALQKNGSSLANVARKLEVSRTTVTLVVQGKATSRRVANEIAAQTNRSVSRLFPGRYGQRVA